jgi:YD repeat-containing protein
MNNARLLTVAALLCGVGFWLFVEPCAGQQASSRTNKFYYDHTDRLVGAEYGRGVSIAYVYDGNGDLVRQVSLDRSSETNGLPVLWQFLNGLTNNTPADGLYGDPDGDGWSNLQEYYAGTSPTDATQYPGRALRLQLPFVPTSASLAVGNLDQSPGDKIVVGANGSGVFNSNCLFVIRGIELTPSVSTVNFGSAGITSLRVANCRSNAAIYCGTHDTNQGGAIVECMQTGDSWLATPLCRSASADAWVWGAAGGQLLAGFSSLIAGQNDVQRLWFESPHWRTAVAMPCPSVISNSIVIGGMALTNGSLKVLASGGNGSLLFGPPPTSTVFDDFTSAGIDPAKWTTSGFSSWGSQSVNVGAGLMTVAASCGGAISGAIARANVDSIGISLNEGTGLRILIPSAAIAVTAGGVFYYATMECGVMCGGVNLYRNYQYINQTTSISDQNVTVDCIRLATNGVSRFRQGNGPWSQWVEFPLGSQFEFYAFVSSSGPSASVTMSIDYVRYQPCAELMEHGGPGDLVVGNSYYDHVNGVWRFGAPSSGPWQSALNYARTYQGGLAVIRNATDNQITSGNLGGDRWLGIFGDQTGWHRGDGLLNFYANWSGPFPFAGNAGVISTNGSWSAHGTNEAIPALVEVSEIPASDTPVVISAGADPAALVSVQQQTAFLTDGPSSAPRYTGYVAALVDSDQSGNVTDGDQLQLLAFATSDNGSTWVTNSGDRVTVTNTVATNSFPVLAAHVGNDGSRKIFMAEPDGTISKWQHGTNEGQLHRQVYDGNYRGSRWYALSSRIETSGSTGLVGLRTSPYSPTALEIVYWPQVEQSAPPAQIPQTAPVAAVLPNTNILGGTAAISVTISDAEGDASHPYLQYQVPGSSNWQNSTILNVDGASYTPSLRVSALPTGTVHTINWNALADLGPVNTNILVRASAMDVTLTGPWSSAVPFQINPTLVTTNPPVTFNAIASVAGGIKFNWQGSTNAWLYLQRSPVLSGTNATWVNIWTGAPPTLMFGSYTDFFGTNPMEFYRMKIVNP